MEIDFHNVLTTLTFAYVFIMMRKIDNLKKKLDEVDKTDEMS